MASNCKVDVVANYPFFMWKWTFSHEFNLRCRPTANQTNIIEQNENCIEYYYNNNNTWCMFNVQCSAFIHTLYTLCSVFCFLCEFFMNILSFSTFCTVFIRNILFLVISSFFVAKLRLFHFIFFLLQFLCRLHSRIATNIPQWISISLFVW